MTAEAHVRGESYELTLGDSLDLLSTRLSESAAACVMDPPYTAVGGSTNGRSEGHAADTQFFRHWFTDVCEQIRRVVRPDGCAFIFCDWRTLQSVADSMRPRGNRQKAPAWSVQQALVWDRESIGLGSPFRNSFEMIAFARGPEFKSALPRDIPTVIRHRFPYGAHKLHGAEKPVDLCRQLVRWATPNGGTVLDPFAGSASVGVACLAEGRRYVGFEIDEAHFNTARVRLESAVSMLGSDAA